MAGFTYSNLVTDIRNYTEVDSNVLTSAIVNRIIEDAEFRILRDVPIDAYKKQNHFLSRIKCVCMTSFDAYTQKEIIVICADFDWLNS